LSTSEYIGMFMVPVEGTTGTAIKAEGDTIHP
jgi:hypothetical protein